jgi:cAMP-dependent protein kinase regulator
LYNAPRAATITSDAESLLFVLDRQTFNHIVKDASIRRKEKYEAFLKTVSLLETLEDYERSQISEAFKDCKFKAGEKIITEGDKDGKDLFFLVSGSAAAEKVIEEGKPAQEVKQYKEGDYFGELALLRNEPRAASVIAKTDC